MLEKKPRFREIGSIAIAASILGSENPDLVFSRAGLYKYLYNFIGIEDLNNEERKVSFVTLNYDRSLEYFLGKNVQVNCIEKKEKQAYINLEGYEVIHAHGSLGDLMSIPFAANNREFGNIDIGSLSCFPKVCRSIANLAGKLVRSFNSLCVTTYFIRRKRPGSIKTIQKDIFDFFPPNDVLCHSF